MIKLSKRLLTIANLVNDNSKVVDIGCDHGLVSIYLAMNKKNIDISNITVNDCFKAIDSDKYTFKLSDDNMLVSSPTELPTSTSSAE